MNLLITKPRQVVNTTGGNQTMKFINLNREDEKKTQLENFSVRLSLIAARVLNERMDYADVYRMLESESERFANLAAELNHV